MQGIERSQQSITDRTFASGRIEQSKHIPKIVNYMMYQLMHLSPKNSKILIGFTARKKDLPASIS